MTTTPNETHYTALAHEALRMIDDRITDLVHDRLKNDPDFPDYADDEEQETYIGDAIEVVYEKVLAQLTKGA